MSGLLIDGERVWPAEIDIIARRFGVSRPRRDFLVQAVTSGFIFVGFHEFGARVALRPQLASRSALSRLFYIIAERNPERAAIACDPRLSSWELVIGAEDAIARIEQYVTEARSPPPQPLLIDERLPLERCLDIAGGQLLPVLQAWHQRQGRWEADLYGRFQESGLAASMTIARQARGSQRLLIEHWGANLRTFGKEWTRVAPGRDFEDQPNAAVGLVRAAMQRQTIAENVPQLVKSDHVLRRIDGDLAREKFCRLGLPWQTADGAVVVTGIRLARRTFVLERPNQAS